MGKFKGMTAAERAEEMAGRKQMYVPTEVLGIASVCDEHDFKAVKYPGIAGLHLEGRDGVNTATATDGRILVQAMWDKLADGDTDLPPISVPKSVVNAVELDQASDALFTVQVTATGMLEAVSGRVYTAKECPTAREFTPLGKYASTVDIFAQYMDEQRDPENVRRVYLSLKYLNELLDAIEGLTAVGTVKDDTIELSLCGESDPIMIRTVSANVKVRAILVPLSSDKELTDVFKDWPAARPPEGRQPA